MPSLCFINLDLVDVETRQSKPLVFEQVVRKEAQASAPKAATPSGQKKRGRPVGSKNKNRADVGLSPFLLQLQGCIGKALALIGKTLTVVYFVYDGELGHNAGLQMVRKTGLHLISKMRQDAELYLPFVSDGAKRRGAPKKYGQRLAWDALPQAAFRYEEIEDGIKTTVYQTQAWHKKFPQLLNVVLIVKTNLQTGRTAKAILFSDGLSLSAENLVKYYRLRFQIEFSFRDAKQYWGLEDFMNTKETQVANAANFSLFMVTFSQILITKSGLETNSMLDLKTIYRARKITRRIIKSLGICAESIVIDDRIFQAAEIGRIYAKAA